MSGKFLTDRDIFKNDIFFRPKEYRLFTLLVGNAVWQKEGILYCGRHLECGQYIRSYRKLQGDLKYLENNIIKYYSLQTIKRLVDKLVQRGRITIEIIELGTLFTVCNYVAYQQFTELKNGAGEQQVNSRGTVGEQQVNKNKHRINIDKHREEKDVQERNIKFNPDADNDLVDNDPFSCGNKPLGDDYPEQIIISNENINQYMQVWEKCKFSNVRVTSSDLTAGFIHFTETYSDRYEKIFDAFLTATAKAVEYINGNEDLQGKGELGGRMKMTAARFLQCSKGVWWMDKLASGLYDINKTKGDTNGNLKPKHSIPEGKKYDVDPDDDWGAAKIYK